MKCLGVTSEPSDLEIQLRRWFGSSRVAGLCPGDVLSRHLQSLQMLKRSRIMQRMFSAPPCAPDESGPDKSRSCVVHLRQKHDDMPLRSPSKVEALQLA